MLSDTAPNSEVTIACDPKAVSSEQQEYWVKEIVPKLYSQVREIKELSNGWAWRLPSTSEVLLLLTEDLKIERLCCPFVHYTLDIEPNQGPFWLTMTGAEGVKAFLRMSFESAHYFDVQVAKAAGLNIGDSPHITSVETALDVVEKLNEAYAASVQSHDA